MSVGLKASGPSAIDAAEPSDMESARSLVSIIVPCHNAGRFLAAALDSALAQTHPACEVIVVDDGSSDDTPAILEHYAGRVLCLCQENRGPSAARNVALRAAAGAYVAFLDADDRFMPDKIARQATLLDARPEVGLVYTAWRFIDAQGSALPGEGRPRAEGDVLPALLLENPTHLVSAMVRKALLTEIGGFDERLRGCEDWDLFLRLALRGTCWARIDEPLWEYRVHEAQSHQDVRLMLTTAIAVLERAFADPALPAGLRGLQRRALQNAYLRGAAQCWRVGLREDAAHAFHAAARARPAFLAEPDTLRRFCRFLMPAGAQRQAAVVEDWRRVVGTLCAAVDELFMRRDLEPEIAALRWRTRWSVARTAARLLRKRLTGMATS